MLALFLLAILWFSAKNMNLFCFQFSQSVFTAWIHFFSLNYVNLFTKQGNLFSIHSFRILLIKLFLLKKRKSKLNKFWENLFSINSLRNVFLNKIFLVKKLFFNLKKSQKSVFISVKKLWLKDISVKAKLDWKNVLKK